MKNCIEIKELLSLYIDGELDVKTAEEVKKHMRFCPQCSEEMEDIKRIIQSCRDSKDAELPEGFREELHKKLVNEAEKQHAAAVRSKRIIKFMGIGSSIAALLIMAVIIRGVWFNGSFSSKTASPEVAKSAQSAEVGQGNFSLNKDNSSPSDKKKETKSFDKNEPGSSTYELKSFDGSKKTGLDRITSRSEEEGLRSTLPAGSYMQATENVTLKCDKPEDISEKLNEWIFNNNTIAVNITENQSLRASVTDQANILSFKVPSSKYTEFKSLLKTSFPNCEVTFGSLSKVDVTPEINATNKKINELISSSGINSVDADRIKADIEYSKAEVTNLKNDSSYIFININLVKNN